MPDIRYPRSSPGDAAMGRMLIFSIAVHLLAAAFFAGWLSPQSRREERPVYYVDLIYKPVADPQAGRPDGGGGETKAPPQGKTPAAPPTVGPEPASVIAAPVIPKAEPVVVPSPPQVKPQPQPPTASKARPEPKPEAKTKPQPQTGPKPEAKAVSPAAVPDGQKDYQQVLNAVAALQKKRESDHRKEEIAALRERIAALGRRGGADGGSGAGTGTGTVAPLGMPDGKGQEAGVSAGLWLQSYFRANWRLSKYQVSRPDLETVIRVAYDADGNLLRKEIVKSSGDRIFDRSVEDAVLKSRKLPRPLPAPFDEEIIFNLRDLQQ
ncbi:MAG: TonB family protein [Deltaproteobacteria bacterium]|nr:TonB family protein [Deltaproteobacteria bacterium]